MTIMNSGNCSRSLEKCIPPLSSHLGSQTQGDCPGGDVFAGLKPWFPAKIFQRKQGPPRCNKKSTTSQQAHGGTLVPYFWPYFWDIIPLPMV